MQAMQDDEDQLGLGNARLDHVLQQYMLPGLTASALAHLQAACRSMRYLVAEASLACWATAAAGACHPFAPPPPLPPRGHRLLESNLPTMQDHGNRAIG